MPTPQSPLAHFFARIASAARSLSLPQLAEPSDSSGPSIQTLASRGDYAALCELLQAGPHRPPAAAIQSALYFAAESGSAQCAALLATAADPKADNSRALALAASSGKAECVAALIPLSHPPADKSRALRGAASHGKTECVRLLLPVCNPKAARSEALRHAAANGHAECVKLLIPVSDHRSTALCLAAAKGRLDVAKLLFDSLSPNSAILHGRSAAAAARSAGFPLASEQISEWALAQEERILLRSSCLGENTSARISASRRL